MNNIDALLEQLLANSAQLAQLANDLPPNDAAALIDHLKREADRYWYIDARHSLKLAGLMVQIGHTRRDPRQEALGKMAQGDALKMCGQLDLAWETLGVAGDLFHDAEDEVGWARTRIGRLAISVDLNRVSEALTDGNRAREILTQAGQLEFLLRLHLNTAFVYNQMGSHSKALELYHEALRISESLGEAGESYLVPLYTNIGYAYNFLGDFQRALTYYQQAQHISLQRGEVAAAAIAELNQAYILQTQGYYHLALSSLLSVQEVLAGQHPLAYSWARRVMVECYLSLNRHLAARDLAKQVVTDLTTLGADFERALTLQHLAAAEAELGNLEAAQEALDIAESIFASLQATGWNGRTHLRRGRIALRLGNIAAAQQEAQAAELAFASGGQTAHAAAATLLTGQARLAAGDLQQAWEAGGAALHVAQQNKALELRYSAHVLLGHVHEAQGRQVRARREYQVAAAIVDRLQRGLTVTLRPDFLENKSEALHALIRLHLLDSDAACAFTTLERAKSQVMLGYLVNRKGLRWTTNNPRVQSLVEELDRLRAEHHWYYQLAHEPLDPTRPTKVSADQARAEVVVREKRMRALTEQLYLESGQEGAYRHVSIPSVRGIQASLDEGTVLIEFYNDGERLWAFALECSRLSVYPLPVSAQAVQELVRHLRFNIDCALRVGPSQAAQQLTQVAKRLAQRLYEILLRPLDEHVAGRQRLIIIPYGALHYLPFHLLHTGAGYLIEQAEVVILPAAGLITQPRPVRTGGALTLSHSRHGTLSQTRVEAQQVHEMLGGDLYCDEQAQRAVLAAPPCQVLHIAAHGEHRLDQPDLSYIELADGQLYTDDLFQWDLSYELVTLSACETGRAHVAGGDELIGLGRGFLYSGAGALITSLWRVEDAAASTIMVDLYQALQGGAAKAKAVRDAQRLALARDPEQHPAFWGAFQLIGNPEPLTLTDRSPVASVQ